jgi:hypothetical protein
MLFKADEPTLLAGWVLFGNGVNCGVRTGDVTPGVTARVIFYVCCCPANPESLNYGVRERRRPTHPSIDSTSPLSKHPSPDGPISVSLWKISLAV